MPNLVPSLAREGFRQGYTRQSGGCLVSYFGMIANELRDDVNDLPVRDAPLWAYFAHDREHVGISVDDLMARVLPPFVLAHLKKLISGIEARYAGSVRA